MLERLYKRVGRNDICPCGSNKKYKNCECYTSNKGNTLIPNEKVLNHKNDKFKNLLKEC